MPRCTRLPLRLAYRSCGSKVIRELLRGRREEPGNEASDTLPENYFFLLFPVFIVLAFSVSYLRPCKTLAMNMSLSFHLITIGLCAAVLALWMQDFILDAYSLETFLTVLLTFPHAVMLVWLIYQIIHRGNFIGKCFQKIRQVTLGENEFLLNRFG